MTDNRTTASKWASIPLTFERMRKKHDRKQSLKFRINHRTQQAIALQEHAKTDAEREIARQFWHEIFDVEEWRLLSGLSLGLTLAFISIALNGLPEQRTIM